jgi:hypothetical protein
MKRLALYGFRGLLARCGDVQQKTIKPLILQTVAAETLMRADAYSLYSRLTEWGYSHKTVNPSAGEYARDEDGDGFHEVHANTLEGLWPLLRSWLRPHRSISQDKLPHAWAFSSSPATSSGAASACFLRCWGACSKRPQNPYRAKFKMGGEGNVHAPSAPPIANPSYRARPWLVLDPACDRRWLR